MLLHILLGDYFVSEEQQRPMGPEKWSQLLTLMDVILDERIKFDDPMSLESLFQEYTLRKREGQMISPEKLERFLELIQAAIQDAKTRLKATLSQLLGEYYMTLYQGETFDSNKRIQLVELIDITIKETDSRHPPQPVGGIGPDHYVYEDDSQDSSFGPMRTTIFNPLALEHIRTQIEPIDDDLSTTDDDDDVFSNKRSPPRDLSPEKSPKKRRL